MTRTLAAIAAACLLVTSGAARAAANGADTSGADTGGADTGGADTGGADTSGADGSGEGAGTDPAYCPPAEPTDPPSNAVEAIDQQLGAAAELAVDPEQAADDGRVFKWLAAPFVLYEPETSVQFGLFGGFVWRPASFERCTEASTFGLSGFYSLRKQLSINADSNIFVDDGDWQVENDFAFEIYNDDFWGIGPDAYGEEETFSFRGVRSDTTATRHLRGRWHLAGEHRIRWYEVDEVEEGGRLDTQSIAGRRGDLAHGFGVSAIYDSRDRKSATTRGAYLRGGIIGFGRFIGSERQWMRFELDSRGFVPLWLDHVLALQLWSQANTGEPGFQSLAKLGGSEQMRGIYEGRWRDRLAWTTQIEYRAHIIWRFGLAAFFAVGDVAHDFSGLVPEPIKWSTGGGLRFDLSPEEGIALRIDVGVTPPGDTGFYVAIGEAF